MKLLLQAACIVIIMGRCSCNHINDSDQRQLSPELIITGHRGAAGISPENSLEGINIALSLKADRIEVDVHQTRDRVVVLMHDKTIDRTTAGSGEVKTYSFEELSAFGLKENQQIPSLEQAIQKVNGRSVLLIEIKEGGDYYPGIEASVVELIRKYEASDWCIIQSFKDEILQKVHELDASIPLHKLMVTAWFYDLEERPYIKEFSVHHSFISSRLIRKVHALGKKINAWTVNDREKMEDLARKGVDGIITDFPSLKNKVRQ